MTKEKVLFFIIVVAILVVFGLVFWLFFSYGTKNIKVIAPNGAEEWQIGQTYEITWQARGIDKVGIVLFQGKEPKWLAKDIPASAGKYEWKIYPGQDYGSGFWVAVVEYPWREDNKIDYSDASFTITYPILDNCEALSVVQQWPYLANNFPNIRRVFITEENYSGNLDGLQGADAICQKEADAKEYGGTWSAFLGGDSDEETAIKRLEATPRNKEGIFIQAESVLELERGDTCHRLLAKNFEEFLKIFSETKIINQEKLEENFLKSLDNIWLGRLDQNSKKNCIPIAEVLGYTYTPLAEKYSFTVTCQNWTQNKKKVESSSSLPSCYTSSGQSTKVVALAALASGLGAQNYTASMGKYCSNSQKLLCIEK